MAPTSKTIEELTATLIDYRGKTPRKTSRGVVLVTAKVIKAGFIRDANREYIAEDDYDNWMRRGLPRQWDILLTTEAPLGEVAQLRTNERVALAQRVILLRGNPDLIDQSYYFHALKSPVVQAQLRSRSTGTTVLGIKQSELRKVRIPLFSLSTQRKIAATLSAYDDLIANDTRRIRILEGMAQLIYEEWFVKFRFPGHGKSRLVDSGLGLVPEGWTARRASDVLFINPTVIVPRQAESAFVPMRSLSDDSMLIHNVERRTGSGGSKFQNGDTLFARITPCLENGKTGFVQFLPSPDSVACGSTEFIVLRSRALGPEFVYLLARSEAFRNNAIKSMSGATGRQRVQERCFDGFIIAQPPSEALRVFQELVGPMFRLIQVLSLRIDNLRITRDLILPKLISGEIDVERIESDVPVGGGAELASLP